MTQFSDYRLEIRPLSEQDGGGFAASISELAGCIGDGATPEEAVTDLRGAFDAWISTAKEMGREIPVPGAQAKPVPALVRWPRSLHVDLVRAAEEDGVSFNSFVVTICAAALAQRLARHSLTTAAPGTYWTRQASGELVADHVYGGAPNYAICFNRLAGVITKESKASGDFPANSLSGAAAILAKKVEKHHG